VICFSIIINTFRETWFGRNQVSDAAVFIFTSGINGSVVIVAKLTFKLITFIVKFTDNYDIATYSVKINHSCVGNSVTPDRS